MPSVKSSLTVLFDDPFWVLLYEREYGKKYEGRQYELRRERKKEKKKSTRVINRHNFLKHS